MEKISKHTSLDQLVKFVEDNQVMFWSQLDVEIQYDAYETKLITGIPHPLFNGVLRSLYPSKNVKEHVQLTIEHFKHRQVPFAWWVSYRSTPKDLASHLTQQNLLHLGVMPTMVAALNEENTKEENDENFFIKRVEHEKEMSTWGSIVARSFNITGDTITRYCAFFPKLGATFQLQHFMGYYKNQPIGAATLFFTESTGGLYSVCVLPEFRCLGLGTHLMKALLHKAFEYKCRLLAMQSYPIVVDSCQKLGFVRICDYNVFVSSNIGHN